jgi:hypothetical protein
MIEVPRAALLADQIAEVAEFFSFGTNDLTQMTLGMSRDDAGKFLPDYVDEKKAGIFKADPFQSLDQAGVGLLVKMGIEKGRSARGKLKVGICGEHGGDLQSVKFCHRAGMNYVSSSPFRVPVSRLAAAQAVIEDKAAAQAAPKSPSGKAKGKKAKVVAEVKGKRGRPAGSTKKVAATALKAPAKKVVAKMAAVKKAKPLAKSATKAVAKKPAAEVKAVRGRKPKATKLVAAKPAVVKSAVVKPVTKVPAKTAVKAAVKAAAKPAVKKAEKKAKPASAPVAKPVTPTVPAVKRSVGRPKGSAKKA